jgi:hypothetical protein
MKPGFSILRSTRLLANLTPGYTLLLVSSAQAQSQAASAAKPVGPWGFQEVYGIKLNILEEAREVEGISMISHTQNGYGGLLECEYSISRRVSIEAELPWAFGHPTFTGFDLEGTFAVVRDDARGLMVLLGSEFFVPTRSTAKLEVQPYLGFLKSFPSVALLAKLSLPIEKRETSELNVEDELHPALQVGPYFRLNERLFLGVPLTVGKDIDRVAFKSGVDLNLNVTKALRLFFLPEVKFSKRARLSFLLGCFLESD